MLPTNIYLVGRFYLAQSWKNQISNQMKKAVPVSAIELETNDPDLPPGKGSAIPVRFRFRFQFQFDLFTLAFLSVGVLVGLDFWIDWFSSLDRVICSLCVIAGLFVAFFRSEWSGAPSHARIAFAGILCCLAGILICTSFFLDRPKLSGIACGLILAAWCSMKILGESYQQSIALGLVFAIPSAIDAFAARGAFGWLESIAISVTSGLADAAEQSHVREGDSLIFGLGVADKFSCLGKWDSVVSFFGISVFCALAFRRNLVAGTIAVALSAIVWIAVRGSAWVALAWLGNRNGIWYEWSSGLEIGLFLFGALLAVSIDQFFSALLEPIPLEFINKDFPLFAFVWNWLCGLPTLTVTVPQRDEDFGQIEMESLDGSF